MCLRHVAIAGIRDHHLGSITITPPPFFPMTDINLYANPAATSPAAAMVGLLPWPPFSMIMQWCPQALAMVSAGVVNRDTRTMAAKSWKKDSLEGSGSFIWSGWK
ncbi:hypothetical protein JTE90_005267 [Oedothorax gibbosus]|uniref:Uncharacterized protein n=1 Tax=Oedothorax gibbosus TaxID=931172 RepID=A0AAV6U440_9ARAC|nr:hypothetical protein JTE90_005267 [Oedothorax gibbosus]